MLSCDDARKHLGSVETGEPAPGALRDHLASCESCRAEADAVRTDIATLRSELASLAPSPFLEDAVLEAARGERKAPPSRRTFRLSAGIGVAAAASIALLVFVAKLSGEHGEQAAGKEPFADPGGKSLVVAPPTAAQVAALRRARRAKQAGKVETQFYRMIGAPPPGLVVIGGGVLSRLVDNAMRETTGQAYRRLTKDGKQPDLDITIGAPGWKGAVARVRARLVLEYTGNVIVPETLGRALGLHEHEQPVRVTVGGDTSMAGERARAQVRIAGTELATDVEVLREGVALPAVPLQGAGLPQAMRVVIRGERPDNGHTGAQVGLHHDHGTSFVIADVSMGWRNDRKTDVEFSMLKQGPLQAALSYHAGKHPACIVFLPSLDVGGGGPLAWAFRLERVTLKQAFEPGAMVTIARVWRGRTAIPSRESVAHTWAAKDGHVSFVHVRGERGPLRAREVRKDGTVRWHDLSVQSEKVLAVGVTAMGVAHLLGGARRQFQLGDAESTEILKSVLSSEATRAGRNAQGYSALTLAIHAQAATPWKFVETLLYACAHPRVKMRRIVFARADGSAPVAYQLPADRGLNAIRQATAECRVRVVWRNAKLHWEVRGDLTGNSEAMDTEGLRALRALLDAWPHIRPKQWRQAVIHPVGAAQRALPYTKMRSLIEALQASTVDEVLISNTPPRRRR